MLNTPHMRSHCPPTLLPTSMTPPVTYECIFSLSSLNAYSSITRGNVVMHASAAAFKPIRISNRSTPRPQACSPMRLRSRSLGDYRLPLGTVCVQRCSERVIQSAVAQIAYLSLAVRFPNQIVTWRTAMLVRDIHCGGKLAPKAPVPVL